MEACNSLAPLHFAPEIGVFEGMQSFAENTPLTV